MTGERRFERYVVEVDVEVLDRTAAAVFRNDTLRSADGEVLGMVTWDTPGDEIGSTLTMLLAMALQIFPSEQTGIRAFAQSAVTREVVDDYHQEMVLPKWPARGDDGTFPAFKDLGLDS